VLATLPSRRCASGRSRGRGGARYAPFFLALALVGLLVMFVGFPEGAPLRRAATFTYNHVQAVPLPAHDATRRGRSSRSASPASARSACTRCARAAAVALAAGGGARALACWPLARGVGLDRQLGLPTACPRRGAPRPATSTARCRRAGARWCCPASSSPTTTGAGRTTRSSRR
jgi:hypothetical protein